VVVFSVISTTSSYGETGQQPNFYFEEGPGVWNWRIFDVNFFL